MTMNDPVQSEAQLPSYEAPAVAAVTAVNEPLIGVSVIRSPQPVPL
jgi:hypothetical protein